MKRWEQILLVLAAGTMPLGTAWVVSWGALRGEAWPMGNVAVYLAEALLLVAIVLLRKETRRVFAGSNAPWLAFAGLFFLAPVNGGLLIWAHLFVAVLGLLALAAVGEPKWLARGAIAGMAVSALVAWTGLWFGWFAEGNSVLGIAAHPVAQPGTSVVELSGARFARAYGTFPHPNVFGGALVLMLFVLLRFAGDIAREWPRVARVGLPLLAMFFGATLMFTFSRAAWIAMTFALFAWAAECKQRWWLKGEKPDEAALHWVVAPWLIGLLAAGAWLHEPLWTRIRGGERLERMSNEQRVSSLRDGVLLFQSHVLRGVGPGRSVPALAELRPQQPVWQLEPPHLAPLLLMVERGIQGLLGLGLLLVAFWYAARGRSTPESVALAAAWVILGLFDHYPVTSPQFLLLSAACFAMVLRPYGRD